MAYQIAVDVGGTFTDGVLLDDAADTIWVAKSLTTPADPGDAITRVVEMLLSQRPSSSSRERPAGVDRVVHGTTLITNTLLERKGVKTALVVTRGIEDVLDIRREMRYDTYELAAAFPEPLVPPDARFAVDERIAATGAIRRDLNRAEVENLAQRLAREDFAAVAICFLHASINNEHEQAAAAILRKAAPHRSYSLSSEVANEVGEYERMSTVVANAYVQPIVEGYLKMLGARLVTLGITGRIDIMVSHGGFTEAEVAARYPIQLLESGPAGGVLSAINCASIEKIDKVLAFDMGGTTAKSCVSVGSTPSITHVFEFARLRRFKRGSGLPAVSPSIDLIEIGAGGGSIARLNALGLLQVGPNSAGAEPGPACYGLGGTEATVTDADLVLGYISAERFLGGKMKLSVADARRALGQLGSKIGRSAEETAWGIHDVVNENMAAAARTHIAEQGHDARDFTLVATGGAGPVHAVDVARRLGISRVLCPIASGVGSCLGFLAAPARADRSWSRIELIDSFDQADLQQRIAAARRLIAADLGRAGIAAENIVWRTAAEIRYLGQGASLEVDLDDAPIERLTKERLLEGFETEYERLYSCTVPGGIPEIVTWRISGRSSRRLRRYQLSADNRHPELSAGRGERKIYIPRAREFAIVPEFDRYTLAAGTVLHAPAIISEPESTLVVSDNALVTVLASGTIVVDLKAAS